MPEKRKDTERFTFYLSKNTANALDNYVSVNYSIKDSYGAYSQVVDNAVSCFCANMGNKSSCGVDTDLMGLSPKEVEDFGDTFLKNINKELGIEEEVAYEENLPARSRGYFIEGDKDAPSPPVGYRSNGPMMPELTVKEDSEGDEKHE